MIEAEQSMLLKKARVLCRSLKKVAQERQAADHSGDFAFSVVETSDAVGGGAYPTDTLPGFGVKIRGGPLNAETLAARLRLAHVPVIAGIRDDSVILHVRTLLPGDEKSVAASFAEAALNRRFSDQA
jgi:L-seryl-tRNA(Ser) seleniumtransferase